MTSLSKRAEEVFWGDASTMDDVCAADVIERITEALHSVRREADEEIDRLREALKYFQSHGLTEESRKVVEEALNHSTKEGRDA